MSQFFPTGRITEPEHKETANATDRENACMPCADAKVHAEQSDDKKEYACQLRFQVMSWDAPKCKHSKCAKYVNDPANDTHGDI